MAETQRISELMTKAPPVVLSRRDRIERWVMRVLGIVSVAAFTLAAVAAVASAQTASCVNTNLGTRSAPAAADAAAHIAFAQALKDLLAKVSPTDTPADRIGKVATFKIAAQTYVNTLTADQKMRAANPLGRC